MGIDFCLSIFSPRLTHNKKMGRSGWAWAHITRGGNRLSKSWRRQESSRRLLCLGSLGFMLFSSASPLKLPRLIHLKHLDQPDANFPLLLTIHKPSLMALLDGRFFASFSPPYSFNFCLFFLPSDPSSHIEEHLVLLLP
jgi:hypothetical protein